MRYSRNDELGTRFGTGVDFDSLKDETITLREHDSMKQVRASTDEIISAVVNLVVGLKSGRISSRVSRNSWVKVRMNSLVVRNECPYPKLKYLHFMSSFGQSLFLVK